MIIRMPRPSSNFYVLDKRISEDPGLSWGARGLLVYLLGKPDHWQVSPAALVAETAGSTKPSGRDAVYGLLAELQATRYIVRSQARDAAGTLQPVQYLVGECRRDAPLPENPEAAPLTALPYTANPRQVSIEGKQGLTEEGVARARTRGAGVEFDRDSGQFVGLLGQVVEQWAAAYPAINVDDELKRAAAWLIANPKNRKSNYLRFLNNWLARGQDSGGRVSAGLSRTDARTAFNAIITNRFSDGDRDTFDMPH